MNEYLRYYKSLLTSWQWRKLRRKKLNSCTLCERCVSEDRAVPNVAVDVHHIVPVMSAAPDKGRMRSLFFDPHNLQSLCADCHRKVHDEMRLHVGKAERDAVRRRELASFAAKFFCRG